ncbi:MAG: M15 family metallopeptidase [Candidatus Doudnabacteria bacterium]|nr:M15 family metallopeptidase [Candidatus Doudnabacteria bacterium]
MSTKNKILIGLGVCLIALMLGSIFIQHKHPQQKNIVKAEALKPVPIPTALDPNFLTQVNECFIPTAAVYGYDLRITSGFRSLAEQNAIYDSGRTVNGHIVTWAEPGKSLHNYGFAVDVVDRLRGYNIDFDKLAKIGIYCGLEQVDPPHFEHRAGLSTADFEAGKRPPPLTLPCTVMDERYKANQSLTLKDLQACGVPKF